MDVYFLKGHHPEKDIKIGLSPIDIDRDIDNFLIWMNNPEITRTLMTTRPMNKLVERQFLEKLATQQNFHYLMIFVLSTPEPRHVGGVSIEFNEVKHSYKLILCSEECCVHLLDNGKEVISNVPLRKGDIIGRTGTIIGDKGFWGKGVGTTAKILLLHWAFSTYSYLKLINTEAYTTNKASIGMMERSFHKRVATKEGFFYNNGLLDSQIMEISREDWEKNIDYFRSFLI